MPRDNKKKNWGALFAIVALSLTVVTLSSCTVPPPRQPNNVCKIFQQYPKWYWAMQESERKWGIPIAVQMAVIHQESRYQSKVKPPRTKLLGFIPWTRPSSAYGYTQALETTWQQYEKETNNDPACRAHFSDASDFVGWYLSNVRKQTGISKHNAYALYLAYHEGVGGYKRKTYLKKPWLIKVAKKVAYRSRLYQQQLKQCQGKLPKRHFWNIFL